MRAVIRSLAIRFLVTILAASAIVCAEPEGSPAVATSSVATPTILFVGCEAVLTGPVCAVRPGGTLSLWVAAHRDAQLVLEVDGVVVSDTAWRFVEDGLGATFTPEPGTVTLTLRDVTLGWRWTMTLQPEAERAPALRGAEKLLAARRHDDAAAALAAVLPGLTGTARADALKLRADIELGRGALAAADSAYELAFEAALTEGLLRGASVIALTAGFVCTESTHDLACARRWLDRHAELVTVLPEARLRHAYNAGLLADQQGDTRTALREFAAYARDARALGLVKDLAAALLKLGAVYSRIGETTRADLAHRELLGLVGLPPRERALALQSAAWADLEARIRGEPADDPAPRFTEALALFEPGGSFPDATVAAEIRLNLAYAALVRNDPAAASAALAQLVPPNRRALRWQLLLRGRIDLASADFTGALRRFDELAATAAAAGDHPLEWYAAVFAGEALEGLGRTADALDRYRRAVALHADRIAALAVDDGREHFAAEGDLGSRRLIRLLMGLGRVEEAACAARLARAQAFAGLAAATRRPDALAAYRAQRDALDQAMEQSWQRPHLLGEQARTRLRLEGRRLDATLDAALSGPVPTEMSDRSPRPALTCDALRTPRPGQLLLVYYPLERGQVGFAIDAAGTAMTELSALAPTLEARADQLLGPFTAAIDRATEILVIASGPLSTEPFHVLPWRDQLLVDHAPIAYSLDLRPRTSTTALRSAVQLAPVSNLTHAEDELAAAAVALRAAGIATTRLAADAPDLRQRLGTDLLHYVGHAHADGWDSALDLTRERRLTAGDLLSGPAPTIAVLSGCETGLPDPRAQAGGMSLAHALLLAGSSAVIATDARVDDGLAAALTQPLFTALAEGATPAEALRRAQRDRRDHGDWARFRVFIP